MKLLETLALSLYLTLSFALYASAAPENWSKSDNRCPIISDVYTRDVGEVTGELGIYYWCYWFDGNSHHLTMRPTNLMGGFDRAITPVGNKRNDSFYKNYLKTCAQQYVDGWGFCGAI